MRKNIFHSMLFFIFCLPIAFLCLVSLANEWHFPFLLPQGYGIRTWRYLIEVDKSVLRSGVISVLLSLSVAAIVTPLSFITGKVIAKHSQKMKWLVLAYLPYSFSPVIYAFCIFFLFIKLGLAGTFIGVLLAQIIITYPFGVIIFVHHWSQELLEYENLVLTLGGNEQQSFRYVILPLSKHILRIAFIQIFLISWFEYGLTSIIGVGKVQTLSIKTYQFIGESNIYFAGMASLILVIPPLLVLIWNRNYLFSKP